MVFATALYEPVMFLNDVCDLHLKSKGNVNLLPNSMFELVLLTSENKLDRNRSQTSSFTSHTCSDQSIAAALLVPELIVA